MILSFIYGIPALAGVIYTWGDMLFKYNMGHTEWVNFLLVVLAHPWGDNLLLFSSRFTSSYFIESLFLLGGIIFNIFLLYIAGLFLGFLWGKVLGNK